MNADKQSGLGTLDDRELLLSLARKAGEIGLAYFKKQNAVRYKPGNSPVSEADDAIDDFLRESIAIARPDYGWLSEETDDNTDRLECKRVVIADPIDGTRGFIDGRDEWCISVAIVENGRPIEAVLHCPAANRTFIASKGNGLTLEGKQACARQISEKPLVTGSKKLLGAISELADNPFELVPFIPSLAYRIAMVGIGELDGAFARPGASEWDIAAADLIVSEAGGKITDKEGALLQFNRAKVTMPSLIAGTAKAHARVLYLAKEHGLIQ